MNYNQLLNDLAKKESETGEVKNRFDPLEIVEGLQTKKKQAKHGFEMFLERYAESAEAIWQKTKSLIRYWFKHSKTRVSNLLSSEQPESFGQKLSSYSDAANEGFDETRFSILLWNVKRRFPRFADGKLFASIVTTHQFVIGDRFQFCSGLAVGLFLWVCLISIYRWVF